jgi:hypothetical protein
MDAVTTTCPSCGHAVPLGARVVFCPDCDTQCYPRAVNVRPFVLDANAYDPLVATEEIEATITRACDNGAIELLMTHIQYDELMMISDVEKRRRATSLPLVNVPTYGMVVGSSKVGLARFGEPEKIEAIRKGSLRHTNDALIAATAGYERAVLVTCGGRKLIQIADLRLCSSGAPGVMDPGVSVTHESPCR